MTVILVFETVLSRVYKENEWQVAMCLLFCIKRIIC